MKKNLLSVLILINLPLAGQHIIVQSGSLSIGENTTVCLKQTSLVSDGEIVSADSSMLAFKGDLYPIEIEGSSDIQVFHLKIDGNCNLNTNLSVLGNIEFSSGILDLNNSDIRLNGTLKGETKDTRAFSSGSGRIITNANLLSGQANHPGNLGFTITPNQNYDDIEIVRGHEIQLNNNSTSIARYYSMELPDGEFDLSFDYFDPEINGLTENLLTLWVQNIGTWQEIENSSIDTAANFALAHIDETFEKISLLENYKDEFDVSIPNGFSPNNDGQNDFFIIEGAENFPNNRLTVINQWGDVLFEAESYENDWAGTNTTGSGSSKGTVLADGTYFYVFMKDKDKKNSVVSGFVEIKSGK